MDIAEIFNYIMSHKAEIAQMFLSLLGAAAIISKLTPTEADDKVVNFLLALIHGSALNLKKDDPNAKKPE